MNSQLSQFMASTDGAVYPPPGLVAELPVVAPPEPGRPVGRNLSIPGALIGAIDRRILELGRRAG